MSLKVHKVVGYGIIDIAVNGDKIIDKRFDPNGYFYDNLNDEKYHLQEFFELLYKSNPDKWLVDLYSMDYHAAILSDCVHFTIINNHGILTICPPNKSHIWTREDDIIDFCEEETHDHKSCVQFLSHGIPSYNYMMDLRTGEKVASITANEFFELFKKYKDSTSSVEKYSIEPTLSELACDLKCNTIDDAVENIVPLVPDIVIEFCKFLHLFKDNAIAMSLRPMICIYWR